jgi:hypothetical protein
MKTASFKIKKLVQKQKTATERNSKSFNLEAQVNSARSWSRSGVVQKEAGKKSDFQKE